MFISGSFHLPAYCVDEKVAINVEKEKYRDVLAPPSSDIRRTRVARHYVAEIRLFGIRVLPWLRRSSILPDDQ